MTSERIQNPYYPSFRKHWFIEQIAKNKRWTISNQHKMPLDMNKARTRFTIEGAPAPEPPYLESLDDVNDFIPNTKTYTYYLDGLLDGFVILDVEPDCPQEIKDKLLSCAALYREVSMSGHGIHLVFPYPKILSNYPDAAEKIVLKHKQKWYEILVQHYVTFTGHLLPEPDTTDPTLFETIVEELAKEQAPSVKLSTSIETIEDMEKIEKLPCYYYISDLVKSTIHLWLRKNTVKDYGNDFSRFEYATLRIIYQEAKNVAHTSFVLKQHDYTVEELTVIAYQIATAVLDAREKHKQFRRGLPWLYYTAQNAASSIEAWSKQKQEKEKQKGATHVSNE